MILNSKQGLAYSGGDCVPEVDNTGTVFRNTLVLRLTVGTCHQWLLTKYVPFRPFLMIGSVIVVADSCVRLPIDTSRTVQPPVTA